ncbi:MAG: hypothetical protein ACE360_04130 [Hyphomicrobiales bacterium]
MADQASEGIFNRVHPAVRVPDASYLPTIGESIAEDFMRTCFTDHPFNCVSVAIDGNQLTFTANSNSGYDDREFDAYKTRHEAAGWVVALTISSQESDCYRLGRPTRKRTLKHLHAEIQQWMSMPNFEQAQFGPNKLCCFYCASILLAVQQTGQAGHWDIKSHGRIYDYSLPSILYTSDRLGRAYFGDAVYQALARASQRSLQRFETALHQRLKQRVKASAFARARFTRVQYAYPPPPYADYRRRRLRSNGDARAIQRSSSSTAATASSTQSARGRKMRRRSSK